MSLKTVPLPHQEDTLKWTLSLDSYGRVKTGGVIANAMGTGKSLVMYQMILDEIALGGSALIVCPLPVLHQHYDGIKKHTTLDQVCIYHGPKRDPKWAQKAQIVLTTYDVVRYDPSITSFPHTMLFLDEAHIIKNQDTKIFKQCMMLPMPKRWCLTGTPYQNRRENVISLACFVRASPYHLSSWWPHASQEEINIWLADYYFQGT